MGIAAEIAKSLEQAAPARERPASALERITADVYANLRRLARSVMRGERSGHTLQPTAVVHETFLRLARSDLPLHDARHLYCVAAQTMRRVLVDYARERGRMKRTAPAENLPDEQTPPPESVDAVTILDVDAALEELARKAPRAATMLELSYFAGLEDLEISELCGVSLRTVIRERRFAMAFLAARVG